jgi:acyl-CoA reductase-like NAD-dependent aldehyde dehydrogenase
MTALVQTGPLGTKLDPIEETPKDQVAQLVAKAREAQREWAAAPLEERVKHVRRMRDRALDRAEKLAKLIHDEVGKPEEEALLAEVLATADVVDYWSESIEEHLEPMEVELDKLTFPGKSGVIHREPRGVLGVIMPWNFPLALPLRTLVPALLAGNAVVFKPSEASPRVGRAIGELFEGLPEGVLTVIQGGRDVGAALCEADVDMVVFTGSVRAGRQVAHACAERLIPCALELGGKDAAIVLADCDLERAAQGVAWGALSNAGQNCAAIERVYVEAPIAEKFIARLSEIVKGLRFGVDVGPLTTKAQLATVVSHVDGAKAAGAKVLCGGETKDGQGYLPTVVRVDSDDMELMREETFGPVVPVRVVADVEEAIALANASKYGLTASIWTKKASRGEELAHRLRAGVVTVNNHSFTGAIPAAPWSGHGETGYGITNSVLALEGMTRPRFVLVDKSSAKRELWWYPYTPALRVIALAMAALRSGTTSIVGKIAALFRLLGAFPKRFKA